MSSANPRRTLPIDGFVLAIVVTAIIGSMLPATGSAVPVVKHGVTVLIFILFFLYGARLEPRETLDGLKNWKLQGAILASTFVVFPLIGLAMRALVPWALPSTLYVGMLWICLVPYGTVVDQFHLNCPRQRRRSYRRSHYVESLRDLPHAPPSPPLDVD